MTLYLNIKQNKIAVVNWVFLFSVFCRELGVFHSKAFLKIHGYPSADDFEGKKTLHGV